MSAKVATNWPTLIYGVSWAANPNDAARADNFTDLASRVVRGGWTAHRGRPYELDRSETGELELPLDNTDFALDPDNSSSPYYPYVVPYRRLQIWAWWPANLLPFATSSMEPNGTAAWTGLVNATISLQTNHAYMGAKNARLTTVAAGTCSATMDATARVAVTAGQTYTAQSTAVCEAGTSRTATVGINWYNQAGALLSTSTGAAVSLPTPDGSDGLPNVTATAPAGAVTASVTVTFLGATAAGEQFAFDAVALSAGSVVPKLYTPWGGFFERYPMSFEDEQALTTALAVGPFGLSSRFPLDSCLVSQIEFYSPSFLFTLGDDSGSVQAGGLGAVSPSNMTEVSSKYGAGTLPAFGTSDSLLIGSDDTVCTFAATPSTSTTQAQTVLQTGPECIFPSGASPWQYAIYFRSTATGASSAYMAPFVLTSSDVSQYVSILVDPSTGFPFVSMSDGSRSELYGYTQSVCDGKWHLLGLALQPDGKSVRFTLDASIDVQGSAKPAFNFSGLSACQIGGAVAKGGAYSSRGLSGELAMFMGWNSDPGYAVLYSSVTSAGQGWPGLYDWPQADKLRSLSGFAQPLNSDTQVSPMQPLQGVKGKSLQQAWQDIADSAGAFLFENGAGFIDWQSRRDRQLSITPRFVFGENVAAGEIPYEGDVTFDFDPEYLINGVEVQQANGVKVLAQDVASVLKYFPARSSLTSTLLDPLEVEDQASFLVAAYKNPITRLEQITFKPSNLDPATCPNAWPAALGLELGDRVTVTRRKLGGAVLKSRDFFVEHIQLDVMQTPGEFQVGLLLSPCAFDQVMLMGASRGTLSGALLAGATSGSLAPLGDAATNPSETVLGPGVVLQLDPAGTSELIALKTSASQPTPGATGYTSIAVTFEKVTQPASSSGALSNLATTVSCSSPVTATWIVIDGEWMQVTAGSGTSSLTVVRGQRGTLPVPHLSGALIYASTGAGVSSGHSSGAAWSEPLPSGVTSPSTYDPYALLDSTAVLAW